MKVITTLVFVLFALTYSIAQTGQYDVNLVQHPPFLCDDAVIYFDIQIKASNGGTTFRISEQNYRFEYDMSVLTNPRIEQELGISGLINDGIGMSLYEVHSLEGSLGHIVSYNVELLSGAGYLLTNTWVSVGRIAFDIVDPAGCINLNWFTQADYPVTFIGQMDNGVRLIADEGSYGNYATCLPDLCAACPPTLSLSGVIADDIYQADVSITS